MDLKLKKKVIKESNIYLLISLSSFVLVILFLILNIAIEWNVGLFTPLAVFFISFIVFLVLGYGKRELFVANNVTPYRNEQFSSLYKNVSFKLINGISDKDIGSGNIFDFKKMLVSSNTAMGSYKELNFKMSDLTIYRVAPVINLKFANYLYLDFELPYEVEGITLLYSKSLKNATNIDKVFINAMIEDSLSKDFYVAYYDKKTISQLGIDSSLFEAIKDIQSKFNAKGCLLLFDRKHAYFYLEGVKTKLDKIPLPLNAKKKEVAGIEEHIISLPKDLIDLLKLNSEESLDRSLNK